MDNGINKMKTRNKKTHKIMITNKLMYDFALSNIYKYLEIY